MVLKLFLLQLIAHLLADFIFQSQKLSDKKEEKVVSSFHIYHVLIYGTLSYILSLNLYFWKASLLLTILHLFQDVLKSWISKGNKGGNYFFIDQLLHLSVIALVVFAYSEFVGIDYIIDPETKTIAIVAGFILCAKPSNIIIRNLFQVFSISIPPNTSEDPGTNSLPNAGKLIGITERFLTLVLIIMGQYEAVGLIIAAKSIIRFHGTQESEYVLVGTLLSFAIAVFTGIFITLIN